MVKEILEYDIYWLFRVKLSDTSRSQENDFVCVCVCECMKKAIRKLSYYTKGCFLSRTEFGATVMVGKV